MKHMTRLCDASIREQEWAQKLLKEGKFPSGIDYQTLLEHGMYDTSSEEIVITIKAVVYRNKVERA